MSKYIIEIKPEYEDKFKGVMILGAENSNLYVDSNTVDELEELNSDYINEHFGDLQDTAYQKGINDGSLDVKQRVEGAYQRGFEDGKAVHDKGCDGCKYANVAGTHEPCVRCSNSYGNQWTAKDDKIEVGDEVKSLSDSGVEIEGLLPWVVTTVDQGDYCQGIDSKGEVHATKKVRACKTGRHFDIEKILEAMKHD